MPQNKNKNLSGIDLKTVYTKKNLKDSSLPKPGQYPFTRGIYSNMYQGQLWTMRLFSGFGTAQETNKRFHYLLSHGQTGLSVAFDFPTLIGYDSDHPLSHGEAGKTGVAIDSIEDMEALFKGIPLDQVSTSMTINGSAMVLLAMYFALAQKRNIPLSKLRGTVQNDILKEYIAQNTYIYPPHPSIRLIIDSIEFCTKKAPKWNTISISGYHIREAGATAVQELAFTLANGIHYVQCAIERGLKVDEFAPRLSFFFDCHNDFFEEIAKFRAARKIWAHVMKNRFKAKKERSMWLRFHTQTAGVSLTAQQPQNNIIRTALQAIAAVLGGTQSLHTNSLDEALALPTEESAQIALRTQQILAHETGVTQAVDPLGGSYYIEELTGKMEKEALKYIHKIDKMGGIEKAIQSNYLKNEITQSAYQHQKEVTSGEKQIVGVNCFREKEKLKIPTLKIDRRFEKDQIQKLKKLSQRRNPKKVEELLKKLKVTAEGSNNIMPILIEAVLAKATLGEVCDSLRSVFGTYEENSIV